MPPSGRDNTPQTTAQDNPVLRAISHPVALLIFVAGVALMPIMRNEDSLIVGLIGYLATVGVLLIRGSTGSVRAQAVEPEQTQTRRLLARIHGLRNQIRDAVRESPRDARGALKPVVEEVRLLVIHAGRLAVSHQRAVEHLATAQSDALRVESEELLARCEREEDRVVRRQLEEAAGSLAHRIDDLGQLETAAARSEAALLNIETTLDGLHTRILKIITAERGGSVAERTEITREIDTLRAASSTLEELLQDQHLLDA